MDLRSTFLSCIFDALFGDTPLDHIFSHMPISPYAHYGHIWGIWAYGHMGISEKIWSSGVSPKRASKMQLRDFDLSSVGHSSQKLWPKTCFQKKMPCILHYNAKKIRDTISILVRDLAQNAKWSEIFWRSRIQHLEVWGRDLVHFVSPQYTMQCLIG